MLRFQLALVLSFCLLLAGTAWAADLCPFATPPLQSFDTGSFNTSPTQGARAYLGWFHQCVFGLGQDMPNITAAADAAAALYVNKNYLFGIAGDGNMVSEEMGRAGGLITWTGVDPNSSTSMVVLYSLEETNLDADLAAATQLHSKGNLVILLGNKSALQRAVTLNSQYDYAIDTHATSAGGLFLMPDGSWMVNTDIIAKITALWTWTAEFVAGCTRRGKMPPTYESYAVPGASNRTNIINGAKFLDYTPLPAPGGQLGQQYLARVWADFSNVTTGEMAKIHAAAALAVSAKRAGHAVYTYAVAHSLVPIVPCPHDTGLITQINSGWTGLKAGLSPQPGDFILCVGYDSLYTGSGNGNFVETARAAGANLAHCLTDYDQGQLDSIPANELFINEHWGFGDAVVYPPGYDVKICPTSGVIEHGIFWMVNAEMLRILTK